MENAKKNEEQYHPEEQGNALQSGKFKFDGETGLNDLMLREIKLMYYVEKSVSKTFPKIIKNSCNYELIEALYMHQTDTEKQVARIEESFEILQQNPFLIRTEAIEAMIAELDHIIEITKFGLIRDAGIILTLHKIEHYEIASYSILQRYAENLQQNKLFDLFCLSRSEEQQAQMRLEKIATAIRFYHPE